MKILLVDDDANFCSEVASFLTEAAYLVEIANTGVDAISLLTDFGFDLLLLDISMPNMSGLDVCKSIRKAKISIPIIFLTGNSGSAAMEEGLDLGADDYITKPFDTRELLARIRAVTRRAAGFVSNTISAGGATLNPEGRVLSFENAKLNLTATEFGIVELLMRKGSVSMPSKEIFKNVWPSDSEAFSDTVRVHIRILRKKLELLGIKDFIRRNSDGYFISND